jgi:hypothetical protein
VWRPFVCVGCKRRRPIKVKFTWFNFTAGRCMGGGGRWMGVVCVTSRPINLQGKVTLRYLFCGGGVGPTACLDAVARVQNPSVRWESNPVLSTRSQLRKWLHCPGSWLQRRQSSVKNVDWNWIWHKRFIGLCCTGDVLFWNKLTLWSHHGIFFTVGIAVVLLWPGFRALILTAVCLVWR